MLTTLTIFNSVVCIQCGKQFLPTTPVHNLCSQECREVYLDRPLSQRIRNMPKESKRARLERLMAESIPIASKPPK